MKRFVQRIWLEDDGVLSFEWILLVSLLTIGVVGGIAGVRDAIIDEFGDVAQAMICLDQSYTVLHPLEFNVHDDNDQGASNSLFVDAAAFEDCNRNVTFDGQNNPQNPAGHFDAPN